MAKRATKKRLPAWEVSDAFGQRVEPLIPTRQRESAKDYVRKPEEEVKRGRESLFAKHFPARGGSVRSSPCHSHILLAAHHRLARDPSPPRR